MGTPTDSADSGTAEEIDRAGKAGKPVMLYFSNAPVHPDDVDPAQLIRVRDFKTKSYPQGIVESYDTLGEFREKFARHLSLTVRRLIENDAGHGERSPSGVQILVGLAEGADADIMPSPATLQAIRVRCSNVDDIPDYIPPSYQEPLYSSGRINIVQTSTGVNSNYYREVVDYCCKRYLFQQLWFVVENPSSRDSVRDLCLDIRVASMTEDAKLLFTGDKPEFPKTSVDYGMLNFGWGTSNVFQPSSSERVIELGEGGSRMTIELPVLQPKRIIRTNNSFYLGADRTTNVVLSATIYSSSAEPVNRDIELVLEVTDQEYTYQEILGLFKIELPEVAAE